VGAGELLSVQLAISEINAAGGVNGTTLTLTNQDDHSDPDGGRAAASYLVNTVKVPAILGTTGNETLLPASTVTVPAGYRATSYRGDPDLGLTSALIAAGGGAGHFDAAKLFRVLAGPKANPEKTRLDRMYGKAKVDAFLQTFTFAMIGLVELFRDNHIALPAQPRIALRPTV